MAVESIYKSEAGYREIMAFYNAVLARWPQPCETLRLPTRHGETYVIASGKQDAPPLVLLHGAASNAVSWIGDATQYSQHFRVYAVDLLGEAGKSAANRLPWDGPGYAEWLGDVLDGLKIEQVNLLGLSQGGWTALRFATLHPELVSKLVLLTPGGVVNARTSFLLKAIFYSMFGAWGGEKINQIVLGKDPMHPDAVRFMNLIMRHFKSRIEKEYLFTDEELKHLTMPVLLLGGSADALFPVEKAAERLQRLVPQVKVEIIPGMGHALVNMTDRVMPFLRE